MADVFQGYFSSRTKNDFFWKNTRLSLMFVGGPKYRIIEGPGCFTKSRKELHKGWVIYCYWLSSYPMKLCQVQRCLSPALMFLHGVLLHFITETVIVPVHYDVLKSFKILFKVNKQYQILARMWVNKNFHILLYSHFGELCGSTY